MDVNSLMGKTFGNWEVIGLSPSKNKVHCRCMCEKKTEKDVNIYHLTAGRSTSCGCGRVPKKSTINGESWVGKTFHEFTVLEELGDGKVLAQCSCKGPNSIKVLYKYRLKDGTSKSCGCKSSFYKSQAFLVNEEGKQINDWTIKAELGHGFVLAQCTCGTIRKIQKASIKNGTSKSCGHSTNKFEDFTDKTFDNWTVKQELGYGRVLCQCKCGTMNIIRKATLKSGTSKSCGCLKASLTKDTLLDRYGETSTNKIDTPREAWQIEAVSSRENFISYITTHFKSKPTIKQLTVLLSINEASVGRKLIEYQMQDYVTYNSTTSSYEDELVTFIKTIYSGQIIRNTRGVIHPYELDIYLPDKKIAIEFNGNYWHSNLFHNSKYHQNKSLNCMSSGVRLIHIFEYEWNDDRQKEKIKMYLYNILSDNVKTIYARDTQVAYNIDTAVVREFLDKYHLQGYAPSECNVGLMYNNKLISIMTFGKPRFDNNSECELIRLCSDSNYRVVGGAARMLSHFLDNTNYKDIISYCDISKFSGDVYKALGFISDSITSANYVWINFNKPDEVLTRYKTQKQRLLAQGLGNENQTEEEIMYSLGYYKIYNSGNIKFRLQIQ